MCGIAGFVSLNNKLDIKNLIKMTDALAHRGPDNSGYKIIENPNTKVGLGHRRLAILDLSEKANQPMQFDNLIIVFNGEVYNFKEIRKELEGYGYKFISNSDTEVVLKAFHKWGKKAVNKFRGMWAFAIYDFKNRELILCRDRVGVKPLYYYIGPDFILFASELKSFYQIIDFKKEENKQSIYYFFKYGYIPTPYTIFKNTYKLEPGTFLTIKENLSLRKEKYWDAENFVFKEKKEFKNISEEETINELEKILKEAFSLRMIADVPVGMFLSGGIDSSLVSAILQSTSKNKLNTFTIGFYEEDLNEAIWAKKIADYLGTNHTELYLTAKDVLENFDLIPKIFDEPFGDVSAIPTYLVSKLARQKVKVSLSADGGDELFGGYTNYIPVKKLYRYLSKVPYDLRKYIYNIFNNNISAKITEFLLRNKPNSYDRYKKLKESIISENILNIFDISKSYWLDEDLKKLLKFETEEKKSIYTYKNNFKDLLNLILLKDMNTYMTDDILVKVDRTTMAVSLEGREPFLDNKIIEFAISLPSEIKIRKGKTKYILRKILYRYIPRELVDRPKQGFGLPLQKWFRNELKEFLKYYLSEEKLKNTDIFNVQFIKNELDKYFSGRNINVNKFWLILVYMQWREKWIN